MARLIEVVQPGLTQQCFRTSRHVAAGRCKDALILQLQLEKAVLMSRAAKVEAELVEWTRWWHQYDYIDHGSTEEHAVDGVGQDCVLQAVLHELVGSGALQQEADECLNSNCNFNDSCSVRINEDADSTLVESAGSVMASRDVSSCNDADEEESFSVSSISISACPLGDPDGSTVADMGMRSLGKQFMKAGSSDNAVRLVRKSCGHAVRGARGQPIGSMPLRSVGKSCCTEISGCVCNRASERLTEDEPAWAALFEKSLRAQLNHTCTRSSLDNG